VPASRSLAVSAIVHAAVVAVIRAKLPAGSAGAFSDDDVAAFDARRTSNQPFTPY
jgi:hypothetical protein